MSRQLRLLQATPTLGSFETNRRREKNEERAQSQTRRPTGEIIEFLLFSLLLVAPRSAQKSSRRANNCRLRPLVWLVRLVQASSRTFTPSSPSPAATFVEIPQGASCSRANCGRRLCAAAASSGVARPSGCGHRNHTLPPPMPMPMTPESHSSDSN